MADQQSTSFEIFSYLLYVSLINHIFTFIFLKKCSYNTFFRFHCMQLILLPTEPKFVGSAVIPDNDDRGDDKVYFFFTEREMDAEGVTKAVYSRIGRVCAVRTLQKQNPTKMFILTVILKPIHAFISQNDQGGQRMLVNRWTSFLKTRLICSVAGPNGIDTHFDELGKETTKPYKPRYLMIAFFFFFFLYRTHPHLQVSDVHHIVCQCLIYYCCLCHTNHPI